MLRPAMLRVMAALVALVASATHVSVAAEQAPPAVLDLSGTPATSRTRASAAATLTVAMYESWLGPAALPAGSVRLHPPLVDSQGAMTIESEVAYRLALAWFGERPAAERSHISGIAWYLQSRVVERAFDLQFLRPGYRRQTLCFFGCHVRWSTPYLATNRWADGVGRIEYLRQFSGRDWPSIARPASFTLDPDGIRTALVIASLERELGWPTLQGALRAVAGDPRAHVVATMERAIGRDLTKAFALTTADVHITSVTTTHLSECEGGRCFLNQAALGGAADVPFPLLVRFEFDRDPAVDVWWDGLEAVIAFETATPTTRVRIDPGGVWLLDRNPANNDYYPSPAPAPSMLRWVARWVLWLQDAMLMQTAFV